MTRDNVIAIVFCIAGLLLGAFGGCVGGYYEGQKPLRGIRSQLAHVTAEIETAKQENNRLVGELQEATTNRVEVESELKEARAELTKAKHASSTADKAMSAVAGVSRGNLIAKISEGGGFVQMEDGSIYSTVYGSDLVSNWHPGTVIRIGPHEVSGWCRLINDKRGEVADAQLSAAPVP